MFYIKIDRGGGGGRILTSNIYMTTHYLRFRMLITAYNLVSTICILKVSIRNSVLKHCSGLLGDETIKVKLNVTNYYDR